MVAADEPSTPSTEPQRYVAARAIGLHGAVMKSAIRVTVAIVTWGMCASAVLAGSAEIPVVPFRRQTGLHWLDWLLMLTYLAILLGMGCRYFRQQSDEADYFTAARKHIHPVLVGVSMFATLFSTVSYLGQPGEIINKGPFLVLGSVISIPFAYVIVGYWVIPPLMRERRTSAYELLEHRLGTEVRLLGAALFVMLRLVWMGTLIHLASVALAVVMGVDLKWTPAISTAFTIVAVTYTTMGGLRTVVIADVVQFCLLFLGAVLVIGFVSYKLHGFSWFKLEWSSDWDRQPFFSFDPTHRVTLFGGIVSALVWRVATAGGDQTAVQRYMATRDVVAARRSYLVTEGATLVVYLLLAVLGLALLGFFSKPGTLPPGMSIKQHGDHLFPYFIANYLPVGVSGLLVSGVLAAAMSSVDSGVNAITAVVKRDFLRSDKWQHRNREADLYLSRLMTVGIGVSVVGLSLLVRHVPGNFIEMTTKAVSLMVSPIFTLFVLALRVPFATPLGAFLGAASGLAVGILMAFWDVMTGNPGISFQWIHPGCFVSSLTVGLLISRWGPRPENRRANTVAAVGGIVLLVLICVVLVAIGQ